MQTCRFDQKLGSVILLKYKIIPLSTLDETLGDSWGRYEIFYPVAVFREEIEASASCVSWENPIKPFSHLVNTQFIEKAK